MCWRRVPGQSLWCIPCARNDFYRSSISRRAPYSPPVIPASQLTVSFHVSTVFQKDGRQWRRKRELCLKPKTRDRGGHGALVSKFPGGISSCGGRFGSGHPARILPSTELTRSFCCHLLLFCRKEGPVQSRVGARPERNGCTAVCRGKSARRSRRGGAGLTRELTAAEALLWTEMCGPLFAAKAAVFAGATSSSNPPARLVQKAAAFKLHKNTELSLTA